MRPTARHRRFTVGDDWYGSEPGDWVECICRDCGQKFKLEVGEYEGTNNFVADELDGTTFTLPEKV